MTEKLGSMTNCHGAETVEATHHLNQNAKGQKNQNAKGQKTKMQRAKKRNSTATKKEGYALGLEFIDWDTIVQHDGARLLTCHPTIKMALSAVSGLIRNAISGLSAVSRFKGWPARPGITTPTKA